ncbi:MAG: hypothetical protein QX198_09155 [Methylococcaceae bacterium]
MFIILANIVRQFDDISIIPTLQCGNAVFDAPASTSGTQSRPLQSTLEHCLLRFHAGAWER